MQRKFKVERLQRKNRVRQPGKQAVFATNADGEAEDLSDKKLEDFMVSSAQQPGVCYLRTVRPKQAWQGPDAAEWRNAIEKELNRLRVTGCWRQVADADRDREHNENLKVTPTAIVLQRKACGTFKARLVVLGNLGKGPADGAVDEFRAEATNPISVRTQLCGPVSSGSDIAWADVDAAFINYKLTGAEEIPIWRPAYGGVPRRKVWTQRALCGLRSSAARRNKLVHRKLSDLGHKCSLKDKCFYHKDTKHGRVRLSLHVDDFVVTGARAREGEEKVLEIFKGRLQGRLRPGGPGELTGARRHSQSTRSKQSASWSVSSSQTKKRGRTKRQHRPSTLSLTKRRWSRVGTTGHW